MESISLSREIAAPQATVRDAILDVEHFMRAAQFDDVTVTDVTITDGTVTDGVIELGNTVGLLRIELSLDILHRPDTVLAYEQREGIFETMTTEYQLAESQGTTTVTARTEFALDASFVGPIFDATVIKRQRRRELENQFDHLQETCE
jgi:hypothetical protein